MKRSLFISLATLGKIGYFPARGTLATFVTVPSVILMKYAHMSCMQEIILLSMLTGIALIIIHCAKPYFPYTNDPAPIVLDEVVGCLWAFCQIPLSKAVVIVGVCIFRLLDIRKPWGISLLERLPGAWGIVMDDVAAGIITAIILRVLFFL